jgi:hypothetical protein
MTTMNYCVYLTTYFGNKLPPFYIGSTTTNKINNGYHGSVSSQKYKSIWNEELTNNPHLFKTKAISYHTNRLEAFNKEEKLQKQLNVVQSDLYINQAMANKSFNNYGLKFGEQTSMKHKLARSGKPTWNKGKKCPQISKALKGITPWNKGKTGIYSKESKQKMSEARKLMVGQYNHSSETKEKIRLSNVGKKKPMAYCSCIKCKKTVGINRLSIHLCSKII